MKMSTRWRNLNISWFQILHFHQTFNWPNRTKHLQKTWLLDETTKMTKKTALLISIKDLRMVVCARQNYFSPKNRKTSKYCTAVRIFNRDRSCKRITELQPYLLCPRYQYCQVQSKLPIFCFLLSILKRCKITFLCYRWRSWEVLYSQHVSRE